MERRTGRGILSGTVFPDHLQGVGCKFVFMTDSASS